MRVLFALLLTIAIVGYAAANSPNDDETTLRKLIQAGDSGKRLPLTDDTVFAIGRTLPKPIAGIKQVEAFQNERDKQMAKDRPNSSQRSHIERLDIAKSGDLAYEYSEFTIVYDKSANERTGFDGARLRVWKKVSGQWKIAAQFSRPNNPAPSGATLAAKWCSQNMKSKNTTQTQRRTKP